MKNRLKEVIESLIFISLEPLTLEKIKNVLKEYPEKEVELAMKAMLQMRGESKSSNLQVDIFSQQALSMTYG